MEWLKKFFHPRQPSRSSNAHPSAEFDDGERPIKLQSSDGQVFEVSRLVADQMLVVKAMVDNENYGGEPCIVHPKVKSQSLKSLIEYCERHANANENAGEDEELKRWDSEFVSRVAGGRNSGQEVDLLEAAYYVDVKPVQQLMAQAIADRLAGRPVEEIRRIFGIESDFTPEEEEEIRRENMWAFE